MDKTEAGAWKEVETSKGGAVAVGEIQGGGGNVWERNGADRLDRRPGQVSVPA